MKKYIILLFILSPLLVQSQTFKSYGIHTGFSFHSKGWENPDTLGSYYHNKVYISSYHFGVYGEFLSTKYLSTMTDVSLKWRQYYFEYDLTPNPDEAALVYNNMYFVTIAVYEKLRLEIDRWSVYAYGGFRSNVRFKNSVEKDIQNIFTQTSALTAGTTAGIGFRKRFERFLSISFEVYYDRDLTKTYESSTGFIRNSEIGIRLGFGPFNPAKK